MKAYTDEQVAKVRGALMASTIEQMNEALAILDSGQDMEVVGVVADQRKTFSRVLVTNFYARRSFDAGEEIYAIKPSKD